MADGKAYSELGEVLDEVSRRTRNVRGPYELSAYMKRHAPELGIDPEEIPSGQAVSKYYYGASRPNDRFIARFADMFEMDKRQRGILAWTYAYGFQAAA
jgi:hypothetical protein